VPELYSALSRSNFMTATGADYTEMDPWADLEQGYLYGNKNVVRAVIRFESVWLRSWTGPLMPDSIKEAMKAAEVAPPPPPPPPPPRATSDDSGTKKAAPNKKLPPKKGRATRGGGGD
jgi:hypothetical protein